MIRVRAFTHIGPGQTDRFVASSFARQVAEIVEGSREPRLTVGNLDSVRDFLDVRDVVDAYCRLLDPSVPHGVYNVASGRGVSVREILDTLTELAGITPRIEVDPEQLDRAVQPEMTAKIASVIEPLGFREVVVDPRGYRLGSLNEALSSEVLTRS